MTDAAEPLESDLVSQKILNAIQKEQRMQVKKNQQMMNEATTIIVHGVSHKFDPNDEIFMLSMTNYDALHKMKPDKD